MEVEELGVELVADPGLIYIKFNHLAQLGAEGRSCLIFAGLSREKFSFEMTFPTTGN